MFGAVMLPLSHHYRTKHAGTPYLLQCDNSVGGVSIYIYSLSLSIFTSHV